MAERIEDKINKEWVQKALGGVDFSATQDVISEETLNKEIVMLVQGDNMFGDQVYSYIKVALRNFRALREAMLRGDNFKPSDFGEVVAAGRGSPTQEIRDEMAVKYNMVDVTKRMENVKPAAATNRAQPKFFDEN